MARRKSEEITENTILGLSLKGFIGIICAVIFYVLSLAGLYYTMKAKQDTFELRLSTLENNLKSNNLDVLNYKVDELIKLVRDWKK